MIDVADLRIFVCTTPTNKESFIGISNLPIF